LTVGLVAELWRYPVKSMLGERIEAAEVTARGLAGDRAYALLDVASGRVVSAKIPRHWRRMFELRASYEGEPSPEGLSPALVTFPDGSSMETGQEELAGRLSSELGRAVEAISEAPEGARYRSLPLTQTEGDETEFPLINGFFDTMPLHLLATGTLQHLGSLYPEGRFEVERFRPNVLIETPPGVSGFVDNGWIGKTVAIGDARLRVMAPMIRCVMTTLPQGGLPGDPGILKTAGQHNNANVGVCVMVVEGGVVRVGDSVLVDSG
jgi:uncharacterized protein YcbX